MTNTGENLKFDLAPPVKRKPLYTDDELVASILDQLKTLNTNQADTFNRLDVLDNAIELIMAAMPALVDQIVDDMDMDTDRPNT